MFCFLGMSATYVTLLSYVRLCFILKIPNCNAPLNLNKIIIKFYKGLLSSEYTVCLTHRFVNL